MCSQHEKKLNSFDGVQANVNFATSKANISLSNSKVTNEQLTGEIIKLGYKAVLETDSPEASKELEAVVEKEYKILKISFIIFCYFFYSAITGYVCKNGGFS